MILVDSSVWIDYFNGLNNSQTQWLDGSLGDTDIVIGDLILTEVLQGFQKDGDFNTARKLLDNLPFMPMLGKEMALQSAANYCILRKKGVTIRKTIDVMIATFCLGQDLAFIHNDKDFEPMVKFLGLKLVDL